MIWYVLAFSQEHKNVYIELCDIKTLEVQIWNKIMFDITSWFFKLILPLFMLWVWCNVVCLNHLLQCLFYFWRWWLYLNFATVTFLQWSDCFTINRFDPQVYEGIKFFTMFFTNDSSCVRKNNNVRRMTVF